MRTLTLRLSDQDAMELELLISQHDGIKTASKMLLHCMRQYQLLIDSLKDSDRRLADFEYREAVLTKIIDDARSACAVVVDRTSQQDFLTSPVD